MTKKLKIPKIARSLFYGLALFMYINCSVKEDLIELNKSIIHRKIKIDELKKDKLLMDDLSNYSKIMRQSNLNQKSTDSLVVNFSSANYVETDEFISYTFNMPSSSVPLRNFLLKKQKNSTGGFHGYVLNYNLTQEELNSLNTLELTNLSNKVTSVKIGSNFSPAMFGKSVYCPGIVGICYVGDPDGHVAYGSECTVSAVQVEMFPCPEDGGGGTPSDPINPPPPNDNTGGSDSNQIVIIPTFNDSDFSDFDNQCKANFFISPSVTSDMRNWLNHFNNIFFKNKIYEMVEDQSSCEENHTEALAIWNFLYNNQSIASSIIDFVTQGGDQNLAWNFIDFLIELETNENLLLDIPCNQIQYWQSISQHQVPQSVKDKIKNIDNQTGWFTSAGIQTLNDSNNGAVVNMDFFPVTITQMPKKPNGQTYTQKELFDHIRKNINDFFDDLIFTPIVDSNYNINDTSLWLSNNPLGAILKINIIGNQGSVVCSKFNSTTGEWYFTTISDPWSGDHPVSGNRAFGYYTDVNGNMVIYTRGVDRLTDGTYMYGPNGVAAEMAQQAIAFSQADSKWSNFQNKIKNFVNTGQSNNNNNGQSTVNIPVKYRPNWNKVKEVLNGTRPISDLGCD